MPTIKIFANCRLAIYPDEHGIPHFHLEFSNGDRCSVAIETGALIVGEITPKRRIKEVLTWAQENREFLLQQWKEITG
jgi:hypothetical protein